MFLHVLRNQNQTKVYKNCYCLQNSLRATLLSHAYVFTRLMCSKKAACIIFSSSNHNEFISVMKPKQILHCHTSSFKQVGVGDYMWLIK